VKIRGKDKGDPKGRSPRPKRPRARGGAMLQSPEEPYTAAVAAASVAPAKFLHLASLLILGLLSCSACDDKIAKIHSIELDAAEFVGFDTDTAG